MEQMMKKNSIIRFGAIGLTFLILVIYLISGIVNVQLGEVMLEIKMLGDNRGTVEEREAGTGWLDPITYDTYTYDARKRQYDDNLREMESQTKDGQPVLVDLSLEIGLIRSGIKNLHKEIGPDWYMRSVFPFIRSAVRVVGTPSQMSDNIYTEEGKVAIRDALQKAVDDKFKPLGIDILVNLRDISFSNAQFVASLENKAIAAQKILIEQRNAVAAEHRAKGVENTAEGNKQKVIKEAEGESERLRLQGLGQRQQQEEIAKGILAVGQAEAEVVRLKNEAMSGAGGDKIVALAWAENLGPNVKVYGVPTGAPGTASMMDLNGMLGGAFKGMAAGK